MAETSQGDLPAALQERIAATRLALSDNFARLTESRVRLRETLACLRNGRSEREILHDVAYARLVARLHTMPVIEQAKGILMAESNCTADEAFAMLRSASQRSNTKLRDLAEDIVRRVSGGGPGGPAQPSADEPPPAA
jgi:hypothetical protein